MATNPIIKIIEPILAIGFIIHIIWASVLTLQNQKARPVKYALRNQSQNATWASRNMYILGAMVLIFLVIHLYNFWWNIKFRLWELRCQPLQSEVLKWKILTHWFPAYSNQALYTV